MKPKSKMSRSDLCTYNAFLEDGIITQHEGVPKKVKKDVYYGDPMEGR